MSRLYGSVVVLLAALAALVAVSSAADRKWWETAVVYQIYPRSFKDSDGDGIGDLKGITSKLQYLKDLGVGAVWLSPIYPSPQADFGYDISNFIDIDHQYGTLADFDELLKEAHQLGLKVVLDFVPNHSSPDHEWFKKSVARQDPYTNYYVWKDAKIGSDGSRQPPNNWLSVFRGSAWEYNEKRGQFYLHQFAIGQPDLNYNNQDLVNEMKEALRFWLKKGVDGFRVDAIPHLFEVSSFADEAKSGNTDDPLAYDYLVHNLTTNQDQTYDMVTQWRSVIQEFDDDRIMMTEAYATLDQTMRYYGTAEKPGASFSFNFLLISNLGRSSSATDFKTTIDSWMALMTDFRKPNWVIGNHDKNRVGSWARYGQDLCDGINMISLMLPGTAMTYNGEEIGMDDTFIRWDQTLDPQGLNQGECCYAESTRDPQRTPFQWDATTSAGFSSNTKTWLPVNPNYWHLNLKAQQEAKASHFHMYKALIEARNKPAVQAANNYEVKVKLNNVLALYRTLSGQDSFIVVVNFESEEKSMTPKDLGDYSKLTVWTASMNSGIAPGSTFDGAITLRPKAALVLTTGDSGYVSATSRTVNSVLLLSILLSLILCL